MRELQNYKPATRQRPVEWHLAVMQDPGQWPAKPFLPVVHRTKSMLEKYGLGILREGYGPRVYYLNFAALVACGGGSLERVNKMLDAAPFVEYASFEALARNWFVDD